MRLLYVKFVCVKLLYVKFIVVYVRRREEEEKEPGIQNQKQEPHTKMWGNMCDHPLTLHPHQLLLYMPIK